MAILTQNDLDIYAEAYGTTPWQAAGMTSVGYISALKGTPLPKAFSLAAKKLSKQLSPQPLVDGEEIQKMHKLYNPTVAINKYKKKQQVEIPLLSSYAVRTV